MCLKPERSAGFLTLLTAEVRVFLDERLPRSDPAVALLAHLGAGDDTRKVLANAYARAAPTLTPAGIHTPSVVLAVPSGEAGDRVRRLAQEACPGVAFVPAAAADDILIHREFPRIELAALPQAGSHARDAYDTQLAFDHTPHARADVPWVVPGG